EMSRPPTLTPGCDFRSRMCHPPGGPAGRTRGALQRMKITDVECLILANEHPIVRIATDEGLVGWGECFRRARLLVKPAIEQYFRPALLGANALDTAVLHHRLMGMAAVAGPPGTLATAVAGIDIALWDLKGKALGQPIWQ